MEPAESIWRPLGELLVDKGLVTKEELDCALTEQSESGRLLGAILVDRGYVSGPALAVAGPASATTDDFLAPQPRPFAPTSPWNVVLLDTTPLSPRWSSP